MLKKNEKERKREMKGGELTGCVYVCAHVKVVSKTLCNASPQLPILIKCFFVLSCIVTFEDKTHVPKSRLIDLFENLSVACSKRSMFL